MAKLQNEKIILKATFTDDSGNLTDPSVPVTVRIKDPIGGIEVSGSSATKQSTGVYEFEHTFLKSGLYKYRFKSADGAIETKTLEIVDDEVE